MANPLQRTPSAQLEVQQPESVLSQMSPGSMDSQRLGSRSAIGGLARHTLGLVLLLAVVLLWTASNFLGSHLFADNTYAKPFFLTYLNTSCFILAAIPVIIRSGHQRYQDGMLYATVRKFFSNRRLRDLYRDDAESERFLKPDGDEPVLRGQHNHRPKRIRMHLGFKSTAKLSFAFCILWFCANYFAMACLQYTTVASTTILTSTSSVWTLLLGAVTHTETFTWRKLCGVLGSLVGIMITSSKDLSTKPAPGSSPSTRAIESSPDKSASELALGDFLALVSAFIYGAYTITLKRATIKAAPLSLNMPLFFGLTGLFNAVFLFPLFPILHWTGLETFVFPPTRRIWTILLVNSSFSLLSDICWAYAMVLTSPLVVTVGLSLTIPLSLVGEMIIQGRTEGLLYWIGAIIVVFSFVFVDKQEPKEKAVEPLSVLDGQSADTNEILDEDNDSDEIRSVHDTDELLR